MSDEQENSPEANGPKPIRIGKRSLFTPSEAVAVEQHSVTPHVSRTRYGTARIEGRLSSPNARVPAVISQHCGGITVKGHTLKSFAYTTDAVIIRNTNANAILAVYPFTGEPVITHVTGGVSGPAVLPVGLAAVWRVRAALPEIPIIGIGGIDSGETALEDLYAGANAVEVGAAALFEPTAPLRVARELDDLLDERPELADKLAKGETWR